jgi:hypothetical protein
MQNSEHQFRWQTIPQDNGDIDVLPIGEPQHGYGSYCPCEPRVKVVGSNLVIVHNAFDHREILDEAEEIVGIKPQKWLKE